MDELAAGFLAWLGRGFSRFFLHVFDLEFVPRLIRFPGTVITAITFDSNRYRDEAPVLAEYVVGALFWLTVLFGIYLLLHRGA